MNLEKFTQVMTQKLTLRDMDEEIRQIFLALDASCTGFITLADLKKVCAEATPSIKSTTIEQIFREADLDYDGRVSFRDFDKIMKENVEGN